MLKALLIGNKASGSGHRLRSVDVPGRWILDPATVRAEDVRGADLVALFGGDGTMQITLSQILREMPASDLPPIAIMPFGTTNMNAGDLNQSKSKSQTIASLNAMLRDEQLTLQSRRMVRVQQGSQVEYGFFFGLGVIANVVQQWNDQRTHGALTNQVRSLWAMIAGLRSTTSACEIVVNGEHLSVYGLLGTTLNRLLFGSRPYWGASASDSLRLTWVNADARQLMRRAPALLRGDPRLAGIPGYESRSVPEIRLSSNGPYIIDGEIFHTTGEAMTLSCSEDIQWVAL